MNARHLILIVLTGAGLIVFAPASKNTEPVRIVQIAEKPAATPSPPVKKIQVVLPQTKAVLPPRLGLDGAGVLQPTSNRSVRRVLIDDKTGAPPDTDD